MSHKIGVVFTKKGDMKFISHLDLMRLFQRALRRSGLPVYITKGFNPHPKVSIRRALKLGVESDNEEAQFYLDNADVKPQEFKERLNKQLPEGIKIKDAEANID